MLDVMLDGRGNQQAIGDCREGSGATTENRSHNRVNEITGIITTGGTSSTANFTYDANGNLLNDGIRSYTYDAFNRLLTVKNPGGSTTWGTYSYDAMGRRIRKVVSNGGISGSATNGTTDFIYDGQQIIEDRNPFGGGGSTDTAVSQYVWGRYIDELLQMRTISGSVDQYLMSDLLYRAQALIASDGTMVEAYDTDPYGNTLVFNAAGSGANWFADDATQTTGTPMNRYIFTGREYDAETQLCYYRTRYYVTKLGRFVNRNPWGVIQGRINLYDFNRSNPVANLEPFSCSLPAWLIGANALDEVPGLGEVIIVTTIVVLLVQKPPAPIPAPPLAPPTPVPPLVPDPTEEPKGKPDPRVPRFPPYIDPTLPDGKRHSCREEHPNLIECFELVNYVYMSEKKAVERVMKAVLNDCGEASPIYQPAKDGPCGLGTKYKTGWHDMVVGGGRKISVVGCTCCEEVPGETVIREMSGSPDCPGLLGEGDYI